jgi:hypothetical protein
MNEKLIAVCAHEGCDEPADGLDDVHCQEHWEALSDAMWWEQVRACQFATAGIKNAKDE